MPGLEDFNDKGDGVFPIGNQVIMEQGEGFMIDQLVFPLSLA
jgi:hypothetical protein